VIRAYGGETILTALKPFLKTAVIPAVITLEVYSLILIAFLLNGYSLSSFIVAGDQLTNTAAPIPVINGPGYDGQFYYRLAIDPFTNVQTDHFITLDNPHYRHQRILYPLLVHILSFGHFDIVPEVMVFVNLVSLVILAALGGTLLSRFNKNPLLAVTIPINYGMLISFTHDLTEIVAVTFCLAGLVALPRKWPAVIFLCLAILTKETSLILAVSILVVAGWQRWKNWPIFLLPVVLYILWQASLFALWGMGNGIAINNITFPLMGFLTFARNMINLKDYTHLTLLFMIAAFTLLCLTVVRDRSIPLYIRLAWLLYVALFFSLSRNVWVEANAYMRAGSEWFALGIILLVHIRPVSVFNNILAVRFEKLVKNDLIRDQGVETQPRLPNHLQT
jgi:hypothetical protein